MLDFPVADFDLAIDLAGAQALKRQLAANLFQKIRVFNALAPQGAAQFFGRQVVFLGNLLHGLTERFIVDAETGFFGQV